VANRGAPTDFQAVLARSSFLVNGEQAAGRPAETVSLQEGAVIEVLPPFAGG
jgi:sulfur-carrier protein